MDVKRIIQYEINIATLEEYRSVIHPNMGLPTPLEIAKIAIKPVTVDASSLK